MSTALQVCKCQSKSSPFHSKVQAIISGFARTETFGINQLTQIRHASLEHINQLTQIRHASLEQLNQCAGRLLYQDYLELKLC